MRKRTTGALIGLLGSTALLAGCGQASAIDAAAPAAQAHTAQRDISGSNCTAQDFRVDLNVQPGHPDQFLLAMTNTSGKPCEIGGWVNLKPQNMAGETIEQIPARTVEVPGPPERSTLQPGRTAFAGVHLELGAKNDPGTYVTSGFLAAPSDMAGVGSARVVGNEGPVEIPLKSLQIGTLQPSPQGVLF